jgi:hypothetical protein
MMREIKYTAWEFHHDPMKRSAPLPYFLLDIPYLFITGTIPPLAIINSILSKGGGDGGMGPGTSWEPFTMTEAEYREVVEELLTVPVDQMKKYARFVPRELREDPEHHHHHDFRGFLKAAKEKHGIAY